MSNLLVHKALGSSRLKWLLLLAGVCVLLGLLFLRPHANSKADDLPIGLLGGSCLAVVGFIWWRKKGLSREARGTGRIELIEKIQLEPGCHLHLVEIDSHRLVLTNSDKGLRLLTRLGVDSCSDREDS